MTWKDSPLARRALAVVCLACASSTLAVDPVWAQVDVRITPERFEVAARGASLAEVLDEVAAALGASVIYDGAPPGQRVTLSVTARTAAELVLRLLEGQGLDFALETDDSHTGVDTLLIASRTAGRGARRRVPPAVPEVPLASGRADRPATPPGPFQNLTPPDAAAAAAADDDAETNAAEAAKPPPDPATIRPTPAPAPTPLRLDTAAQEPEARPTPELRR